MQQAENQLEGSATRVAGAGAASVSGMPVDQVDLSKEAVTQMSAKNDFAANLAVLKTADEIEKATIDMMG